MDNIKLFISYSHKDEEYRQKLTEHLNLLEHEGVMYTWSDRNISPGDEWDKEINENLNEAQIILLLISVHSLNSRYIREVEITQALERHKAEEAVVIPVILQKVYWQTPPLSSLQALPAEGRPVDDWPLDNDAYYDIVLGVLKKVHDLKGRGSENTTESELIKPPPSRRLKWKKVTLATVLTLVLMVSIIVILMTGPALDAARKVNYLDNSSWTPPQVGWKIKSIHVSENDDSPVNEKTGHLIKGNQMGLLGKSGLNPYSLYQDFNMDINVSMVNGKGVAWVVRAKDFNNFCLFEIYPPKLINGPISRAYAGKFVRSFYKDGKRTREEISPLTVSIENDLSSIVIHTEVQTDNTSPLAKYFRSLFRAKSKFKVQANTRLTPEFKVLCDFEDEYGDAAPYGGVGFYPRNGMEFILLQLSIDPILSKNSDL